MHIHANATVSVTFKVTISEAEAKALDRIAGYSPASVLEAIAKVCGDSVIREHADGLAKFFGTVGGEVSPALAAVRKAREELRKAEECRLSNVRAIQLQQHSHGERA